MANIEDDDFVLPEITAGELNDWLSAHPDGVLLDVREPHELRYARLKDDHVVNAPLSDLARRGAEALPDAITSGGDVEVVVMCHLGSRSAQVTAWLLQGGLKNVYNLAGGIDAYARLVDPTVGLY